MKSLEIVDLMLKYKVYNDELVQQIKQDLEVLEIIRKKEVNVRTLQYYLSAFKEKKDIVQLNLYNAFLEENFKLTMEELLKLKQWLEENENDR